MGEIFTDRVRTDPSPSRHVETTFPFLDRVDDPAFARVRELIEAWFAAYPSDGSGKQRDELRGRFISGSDQDFASAFWELYLHEAYRRAGYAATPHPSTPTGAEVDFLMVREDGARFYLEATGSMKNSLTGGGPPTGSAEVLDKIEEAFNPDFFLGVKQLIPGTATPSTGSVVKPVECWLGSLDWNEVTRTAKVAGGTYPRTALGFGNGWRADVEAFPKGELRGQRECVRTIATYPPLGGISTARPDMLAKLKQKASRYGRLDAPFVIALQATAVAGDEEDVSQALFGSEAVRVAIGPPDVDPGKPELLRNADGLWQWGGEKRGTRVSGVLAAPGFSQYSIARQWPRLWTNPWAAHPLDLSGLPWPRMEPDLELDQLAARDAPAPPWSYLGLSPDWPGEPFKCARARREDLDGDPTPE